ncbi:MAG: hypothetical protein FWG10_14630 [Eubacteriaceae bacterium]|nr:hypothetical protein [Eubacteriaceae bacterium]
MADKKARPFETLAIKCLPKKNNTIFKLDDTNQEWFHPLDDAICWNELWIYGVPDSWRDNRDKISEIDYLDATLIGKITGCHIINYVLMEFNFDLKNINFNGDIGLEVLCNYLEGNENTDIDDSFDNYYYLKEFHIEKKFEGMGYEVEILEQLPLIIMRELCAYPELAICYFAMEQKELERMLSSPKRKTKSKTYQNKPLYKSFESAGFTEAGSSGWLYTVNELNSDIDEELSTLYTEVQEQLYNDLFKTLFSADDEGTEDEDDDDWDLYF